MKIEIPHLDDIPQLIDRVEKLSASVEMMQREPHEAKRWFTLQDAWGIRGGASYNTFRNDPLDQPRLGMPDGHQHGRRVWSRETIERWATITDEKRTAYYDELLSDDPDGVIRARLLEIGRKESKYRDYIAALESQEWCGGDEVERYRKDIEACTSIPELVDVFKEAYGALEGNPEGRQVLVEAKERKKAEIMQAKHAETGAAR